MVTNLNQLKKALTIGTRFEVVEHFYHPNCAGQIREVTKVQTNGIYSKPVARTTGEWNETDEKWANGNGGLGLWLAFDKAENWSFCNGLIQYKDVFSTYENGERVKAIRPISTFRLM